MTKKKLKKLRAKRALLKSQEEIKPDYVEDMDGNLVDRSKLEKDKDNLLTEMRMMWAGKRETIC